MYGKLFASAFTGSMFGAGADVFAVWSYIVAHVRESIVEVNPAMLGAIIGIDQARVSDALAYLEAPDPQSRNPEHDGRRLLHEGGYQYRVVSHALYLGIRNEEERREYNRQAQAKSRAKRKASTVTSMTVIDKSAPSATVSHGQPSKKQSAEADEEEEVRKKNVLAHAGAFADFWSRYPRKVGKVAAEKAWRKLNPDAGLIVELYAALDWQVLSTEWTKDGGAFVPHPSTWLNGQRWQDERTDDVPRGRPSNLPQWLQDAAAVTAQENQK